MSIVFFYSGSKKSLKKVNKTVTDKVKMSLVP